MPRQKTVSIHGYPITEKQVQLKYSLVKIAVVANPEPLIDQAEHEDNFPDWAEIWPSAIGLANFIETPNAPILGKCILEIGCGLGLTGIVACQQKRKVIFTDWKIDPLFFAHYNTSLNRCNDLARFIQMDWKSLCLAPKAYRFPLILGSDVIYEEKNWELILKLISNLLTDTGEVILSEPNRANTSAFFSLLRSMGFIHQKFSEPVYMNNAISRIAIYRIRRNFV